jgi:hypothetical protein
MEANQLRELATNAQLDHWPPHLGVTTDAEKIAYLAECLGEAVDYGMDQESLAASRDDEISELKVKIDDLETDFEQRIESLRDDLEKLEEESE